MNDDIDDYLLISGVQHFAFCRRQWALIHLEQQWAENALTVEGDILHERSHDEDFNEKRGDLITTRGMRVFSHALRATGACDVVEFHASPDGVKLSGREGLWLPFPVEYKRGKPKKDEADELQLCAQAICLSEMLACEVSMGYLYYGEIRSRVPIPLTDELREHTRAAFTEMGELYARGHTPIVKPSPKCKGCSMRDLCLPSLPRRPAASDYVSGHLNEVE